MKNIPPSLLAGLEAALAMTAEARDPWWLIGSAAMALHDAPVDVADLDLLLSRADARAVLQTAGCTPARESQHGLFRSEVFGRIEASPLPIEVMGGFHVRAGSQWHEVIPVSREPVPLATGVVYVPSAGDLIKMCRLFGRSKDKEREALLLALR